MTVIHDGRFGGGAVELARRRVEVLTDRESLIAEACDFARKLCRDGESAWRAAQAAEEWVNNVLANDRRLQQNWWPTPPDGPSAA